MYYSIVYKDSGAMLDNIPNIREDQDRPLHESLIYVPANDFLIKLLVSLDPKDHINDKPVNWINSRWDFNSNGWIIEYEEPPLAVDPVQTQIDLRDKLLKEANKKMLIADLPEQLTVLLQNYITELESTDVTEETASTIVWPELPV